MMKINRKISKKTGNPCGSNTHTHTHTGDFIKQLSNRIRDE